MIKIISLGLLLLLLFSFNRSQDPDSLIKVEFVESLEGDFSFVNKWDYRSGVIRNPDGSFQCGLCDYRVDKMRDAAGNILPDSLSAYYQLVDTTHYSHTLECEAQCYEFAGSNYAYVFKRKDGSISIFTGCNIATHSSLEIELSGTKATSLIVLNSITTRGEKTKDGLFSDGKIRYKCSGGTLRIDSKMLKKNVFKAEFDLTFVNHENANFPIWWKGKIMAPIQNIENR